MTEPIRVMKWTEIITPYLLIGVFGLFVKQFRNTKLGALLLKLYIKLVDNDLKKFGKKATITDYFYPVYFLKIAMFSFLNRLNRNKVIINSSPSPEYFYPELICHNYSDVFDIFYVNNATEELMGNFVALINDEPDIEKIAKFVKETSIKGFRYKQDFLIKTPSIQYMLYIASYRQNLNPLCIIESYRTNITRPYYHFDTIDSLVNQIIKQAEHLRKGNIYSGSVLKHYGYLDILIIHYTDEVDAAKLQHFIRVLRNKPNIEVIMNLISETTIKGFSFKKDFVMQKPTIEYLLYLEKYLDDNRLFSIIEHYNQNYQYLEYNFSQISRFVDIIIKQYRRSFYQYLSDKNLPNVPLENDIQILVNNQYFKEWLSEESKYIENNDKLDDKLSI
jgi:hypothetical protein